MRINVYISSKGYCSRREADRLIIAGKVKMNGKQANIGEEVTDTDIVTINDFDVNRKVEPVYLLFHKPIGIETTTDLTKKNNIIDFIGYPERIFPIGRLDKDSSGLLLLTNDGQIVNRILRSENHHEKEYLVTVDQPVTEAFLQSMGAGVEIYNPVRHRYETTLPAKIEKRSETSFTIVLTQGLNLQIRRMSKALHYRVIKLVRTRIMHLNLQDLKPGKWRHLNSNEREQLFLLLQGD